MKPFLMQFAVERIESEGDNVQLSYNEEMDMNEIVTDLKISEEESLRSETTTRVKSESSDYAGSDFLARKLQYLAAKTITEVKAEKPDYCSEPSLIELLSTATSTKTSGEAADKD